MLFELMTIWVKRSHKAQPDFIAYFDTPKPAWVVTILAAVSMLALMASILSSQVQNYSSLVTI